MDVDTQGAGSGQRDSRREPKTERVREARRDRPDARPPEGTSGAGGEGQAEAWRRQDTVFQTRLDALGNALADAQAEAERQHERANDLALQVQTLRAVLRELVDCLPHTSLGHTHRALIGNWRQALEVKDDEVRVEG